MSLFMYLMVIDCDIMLIPCALFISQTAEKVVCFTTTFVSQQPSQFFRNTINTQTHLQCYGIQRQILRKRAISFNEPSLSLSCKFGQGEKEWEKRFRFRFYLPSRRTFRF